MKNIKIFTLLTISLTSINIYALSDDEQSYCFSTDPELGDSAYWASAAINFYNSGQHKKAISVVDNCFEYYAEDALYQQSQLKKAKIQFLKIEKLGLTLKFLKSLKPVCLFWDGKQKV